MRNLLRHAMVALCATASLAAQSFRSYVPQEGLQGTIRMKGSDSIDPMVRLWIQDFQKLQPGVQFTIESKGSGTAPTALVKDEADIGHMSRPMNEKETEAFKSRFGYEPTGFVVSFDALAIYVNRRNPIKQLTIQQLDAIYGSTLLAGAAKPLEGWWDLPVKSSTVWRYWIRPYSRDENSGSRAFFLEHVLQKGGKFKEGVRIKDQMGIMEVVGRDINAIGYGPESYRNPMVRMVPIVGQKSETPYLPTLDNIQSGRYPLSRSLYCYVNHEPGKPLAPAVNAFMSFILSAQGQELSKGYGAAPLTPSLAEAERAKL